MAISELFGHIDWDEFWFRVWVISPFGLLVALVFPDARDCFEDKRDGD